MRIACASPAASAVGTGAANRCSRASVPMSPVSVTSSGIPTWSASENTTGMLSFRDGMTKHSHALM